MTSLSRSKIRILQRKREKLLQELSELTLMIRGSYFERFSTCVRPNCGCHRGHPHGPRAYAAITREKKQRQIHVPKTQTKAVQRGIEQHRRLSEVVDRISDINLELMKGGALDESIE